MTDNQSNTLNMANTTVTYLENNSTIIAANPKAMGAFNKVKLIIADINKTHITQSTDTTGATDNKNKLHLEAVAKAETVCNALIAYADDIEDTVLEAEIHFTHSHFTSGTPSLIIARMETVHKKAKALPPGTLIPFNTTDNDIDDLLIAINKFKAAVPLKKAMTATTAAATKELIPHFSKLRTQLKKLDKIINTYKAQQSIFVNGYTTARTIINLGKTPKTEELHLMPHHFEAIFGMKFEEGDTFTIRNHSTVPIHAALSDVPAQMPEDIIVEIPANKEYKLNVSADFGNKFRHWLMIHNFNDLDDANITIFLAHGKSNSQAQSPGQTA